MTDLAGIVKDIDRREFFLLLPLFIATLVLGVLPNILLDALHVSVSNILYFII
jgi:NADH-ubiquinone oxidoreductase chain 4